MSSQRRGRWPVTGAITLPVLLLVAANATDQLSGSAYTTLLPEIRHHFHLSLTAIGLIAGIAGPIALAVNLPLGWLGDRARRTRIAAIGTFVGAGCALLIGAAVSLPMFVLGAVGAQLGSDGEVAHRSLLADYYPLALRARIFAVYDIGEYAAGALAPLIAGGLAAGFGWRAVFIVAAAPAFVVAGAIRRLHDPRRGETDRLGIGLPDKLAAKEETPAGWLETFRVLGNLRTAQLLYPAIAFSSAASVGYSITIASFWRDSYHLGPFGRGAAAAVASGTGVLGALLVATIAQRRLQQRGAKPFVLLIGSMELLSAAAMIPLVTWHWLPASIGWNCVTIGADAVTETGVAVIAALVIPARMRTLGLATGSAWALLGLAAGPIFGIIADNHGTGFALGLTAVPSAVEGLLVLLTMPVITADLANAARRQTLLAQLDDQRRNAAHGTALADTAPVLTAREIVVESISGRRVDGVDLDVAAGEVVVLTGGNGAGKSTLLEVLCGLVVPDEGVVTVGGVSVGGDAAAAVRAGIVYAPGATSLFDELTVAEHLALATWTRSRAEPRVKEPVSATLKPRLQIRAGELSGGERQLLNLEMALAVPTKVVLLDELGFGLSVQGRADAEVLLRTLHQRGTAIVAVEQKNGQVLQLPHRTVTMDGGRIVEQATARFLVREQRSQADPPPSSGGRLEAIDICVSYPGLLVLDGLSLEVRPGEIVAVAGANGSGKSTLLDVLGGAQLPDSGTVWLDGRDITAVPPQVRAQLGLRRSLQGARLWPTLSVAEAIALAVRHNDQPSPGLVATLTRSAIVEAEEVRTQQVVDELIAHFGLEQWRALPVQRLSTGTRQVASLAALAAGTPRIALIDEPVAGVAAHEHPGIARLVRALADETGAGIVLVEHDDDFVRAVADRVLTLEAGRLTLRSRTRRSRRPAEAAAPR